MTTPSTQDVAWITSPRQAWGRLDRDTPAEPGHLVAFDAGVLLDGYVGELGRTYAVRDAAMPDDGGVDPPALRRRHAALRERLLAACRPGAVTTDLLDAYEDAGEAPPPVPVARGLGMGFDLPLVTHALPELASQQRLESGMVLALTAQVWEEGRGAVFEQEPVLITDTGPELLSADPIHEARSEQT